jgi:hypothetical protein
MVLNGKHDPPARSGAMWQTLWVAAAALGGGFVGLVLFWNFGPVVWAVASVGLAAILFGLVARKASR